MPHSAPTVFVSYSHKDRDALDDLIGAVKPTLANVSTLAVWSDLQIASGDLWEREIRRSLESARAAVLLLSNDFLNSQYIRDTELPALLPRAHTGALRLFTVYVSAVAKPALTFAVPGVPDGGYDLSKIQGENSPSRPLKRMSPANRDALFVGLAEKLHTYAQSLESSPTGAHAPRQPVPRPFKGRPGSGQPRPECSIRLAWDGRSLERSFLPPGHLDWLSPALAAPDALDQLALWQPGLPFDGDLLFELLFGNDSAEYQPLLADPYGDSLVATPIRYPWRIRLLVDERSPLLHCLPWTRISNQGFALADSGWTVELSPPAALGAGAESTSHPFIMPGRILLVFPDHELDPRAAAHLRDVQSFLQRLWDRPAPIFVAADQARLAACLRDYSPRLVYVYGQVERAGGQWRLCIPDGTGGTGLGFADFHGMFSAVPPSAVFFNLLGEYASEAMPETAELLQDPACKFLALQATPRSDVGLAQETALAWLAGVLRDDLRLDPVSALHGNGHAFAACRTAYRHWDAQLGPAHLDEDLVQLLLDRIDQRRALLQARDDFFDLSSKLRVQCFLAAGTGGNRVTDFPDQAITHLKLHTRRGVAAALCAVELLGTDTDPDRLELRYRRRFGLRPSAALSDALRPGPMRQSNESALALLAWTVVDGATADQRRAIARAVVQWSRERLAPACPDDLRIISLLALETADWDELTELFEDLETFDESLTRGGEYQRTASFRFEPLDPLTGVTRRDLSKYFDSEHCTCHDGLRRDYPGLLLAGRKEMSFEEAVRLIRAARDRGWHAMKAELEARTAKL
jgi:hypothetical protein